MGATVIEPLVACVPLQPPLAVQLLPAQPTAGSKANPGSVPLVANFQIQTYAVKTSLSDDAAPPPAKPGKKG